MKKASLVINEIKENKYNDLLADIYVDATNGRIYSKDYIE